MSRTSSLKTTEGMMKMATRNILSSEFSPSSRSVRANCSVYSYSQDRLQIGYQTLTWALPWFHKMGSEMEYDDYAQLLKIVSFHAFDCLEHANRLIRFGRVLTVLEVTTLRNLRLLFPIG